MYKSIFDNGIKNNKNITSWVEELITSLNFVLSVSYIKKPINENSREFFKNDFGDLVDLEPISKLIKKIKDTKINGIQKNNGGVKSFRAGIMFNEIHLFEESHMFLQFLEIIYNIFKITSKVNKIDEMNTQKSDEINRIYLIVESIIKLMGMEFIEVDEDIKNKMFESLECPEYYENFEVDFYKLVKDMDEIKKEGLVDINVRCVNLIKEYQTKNLMTIERKSEILAILSQKVDGKLLMISEIFGDKVKKELGTILNNYNIRHDNFSLESKHYQKDYATLDDSELSSKYDKAFNIIIAFLILN